MFNLTQADLLAAKQKIVDEQVSHLKTPSNSEYYYLSELGENDISLKNAEFVRFCKPYIEYKVEGRYISTLPGQFNKKSVTYKSSVSVSDLDGYVVEESENWKSIPQKHLDKVPSAIFNCPKNSSSLDPFIIADASPKLRSKVRRGGDPIKPEDLFEVKVLSKDLPFGGTAPNGVEWAQIIRNDTGEVIGEAYCINNDKPAFEFVRDESKANLDHSLSKATLDAQKRAARAAEEEAERKAAEAAAIAKKAADAKKKAERQKNAQKRKDRLWSAFGQMVVGIILAAIILVAEFTVILVVNKGTIEKKDPGIYAINVDNWDDYVFFQGSNDTNQYREKIKEKQKRTTSGLFVGYESGEIPMLSIAPRASAFYIFDIKETRHKKPKFQITELYVKVKVTYSFNGVESTVIAEKYIGTPSATGYNFIEVAVPLESIKQSSFMGQLQNNFYADLDYWYFEVIDISGTVEVKEVTK